MIDVDYYKFEDDTKKQQKTPPGEIQLAKERRDDYERRHKK